MKKKDRKGDKKMKVISICNVKGGVGKTTSTIFLSRLLSEHGKTLMIDLDSQNSLTSYFIDDIESFKDKTILQALLSIIPVSDTIISISEKLSIIPADIELCRLATSLTELPEMQLDAIIEPIKNQYDFIIIDCPPNLNLETRQALAISNIIVTPTLLEKWSMRSLDIVADYVQTKNKRLQKLTNTNFEGHYILPTMKEKNRSIQTMVLDDLKKTYQDILEGIHKRTDVQKLAYFGSDASITGTDTYKEYSKVLDSILKLETA